MCVYVRELHERPTLAHEARRGRSILQYLGKAHKSVKVNLKGERRIYML